MNRAALVLVLALAGVSHAAPDGEGNPKASPAPSATPKPKLDATGAYLHAVELLKKGSKAYPEAQRLFRQVPKGHEYHPDATAYLEWLEADLLVRKATTAFRKGEVAPALALLDKARKFKVLGPRAIKSVDDRRQSWTKAVLACRKGIDYANRGKLLQAKMELRPVAEGPLKGGVRAVARAYLSLAEGKTKKVPERERELGRKLLRLDPKVLVSTKPKKPAKGKGKGKKKNKDGWDEGWSDWEEGKSKQPRNTSKDSKEKN